VGLLLLPVACTTGDYKSGPPPPTTTTTLAPEVTLRGVIGAFSASARIVTLAQPVSGIANVVVATDTEVVRASGAAASVTDLVARATIDFTGRPSTPDTLVARRIVLL
jgi:hypothetical protein